MASYDVWFMHKCNSCGEKTMTFPLCVACSVSGEIHEGDVEPIRTGKTIRVKFYRKTKPAT